MKLKNTVWGLIVWASLTLSSCWGNTSPNSSYVANSIQEATVDKTLKCLEDIDSKENSEVYSGILECYPFLSTFKTLTEEQRYDRIENILDKLPKSKMSHTRFSDLQNNLGQHLYLLNTPEVQNVFKKMHEENLHAKDRNKSNGLRQELNNMIPNHLPRIVDNEKNASVSNALNTYYKLVLTDSYSKSYDLYRTLVYLWITPEDAQELYNQYVHDIKTKKDEN